MVTKKHGNTRAPEPVLGGLVPIDCLWIDGTRPALFRSETSARWFVRVNRAELVEARALARFAARTYIHPERFEAVAKRVAFRNVGASCEEATA